MKILNLLLVIALLDLGSLNGSAQTADVTVSIKGVKEAKGKVLVQLGDKSKPDKMVSGMVDVINPDSVVCVLKNVPVGKKLTVSAFQDLNGNWQLDTDEANIPIEPCNTKENVSIKEGECMIEIKLLNVKEMMSGNGPK